MSQGSSNPRQPEERALQLMQDFGRIHDGLRSLRDERLRRLQRMLDDLRPVMAELRAEEARRERSEASCYNIFRLLGVTYDEDRTHSPFLSNLLDPAGSHSQGSDFLESFLALCQAKYPEGFPHLPDSIDSGHWTVRREQRLEFTAAESYGRVDIIIQNPTLHYMLVIENKIRSPERPDQLYRYSLWMEKQSNQYTRQALIYLTPNGAASTTSQGRPYFSLSYHEDIVAWIEGLLVSERVKAERVTSVLRQYLELVRDI